MFSDIHGNSNAISFSRIHIEHCSKCHITLCSLANEIGCEVVPCPNCLILMHSCKIEDHIELVCYKTFLPCINHLNGCDRVLRRDRRGVHLAECPASVVVCSREWGRRALSTSCKLQLKKWGKGEDRMSKEIGDDEIDISMALSDQNELIRSYEYSRKDRVLRRDGLNRRHPVIPLKEIRDENGKIIGPSVPCNALNDEDSSDEERRIEEIKLKKNKAVFANCYICQMDPARQHLHTLGNNSAEYQPSKLSKKTDYVMDKLHWNKNLMINFIPEFFPETTVKGENINFIRAGGCLYIRRCLHSFRRSEYGDHYLSQHVNSLANISELIVRCPNWPRGCEFHTCRLKPNKGRIRFLNCIDSFIHCPEEIKPLIEYSGVSLDSLPIWAILAISKYLPSAELRLLSTVSRTLREILITHMRENSMATIKWSKHLGHWIEDGIIYEFSTADRSTELTWSPANELSNHLLTCTYSDAVKYEQKRICIFPEELKQDIQDKFMERLKPVSSWWSTHQFNLGEEFVLP